MTQLLIASHNPDKVEEIRGYLPADEYSLLSLRDIPNAPRTTENGRTLEANALKKAREAFQATGILSLADDTGLEVYYLELEPGVHSARYAGADATYEDNVRKLLHELEGVPQRRRNARFRSLMAIVGRGIEKVVEGVVEGTILEQPRGTNGFGYDPVFVPRGWNRSFSEMTFEEKNKISHRAEALKKAVEVLKGM